MIEGLSFLENTKNEQLLKNLMISIYECKIFQKSNSAPFKEFKLMFLGDFIEQYREDIRQRLLIDDFKCLNDSMFEVLCFVDVRKVRDNMNIDKLSKYNKTGMKRRQKLESQYFYTNPFNRIHGYVILKKECGSYVPKKEHPINLCLLCTSRYSHLYNIGKYLMLAVKKLVSISKYNSIILEVSNSYEYDLDKEEDSDEEYDYVDTDDCDDTYEDEDTDEDNAYITYLDNEYLINELTNEFFKKSLRFIGKKQDYNIDVDYIRELLTGYINNIDYEYEAHTGTPANPYGGKNYKLGKQSKIELFHFYESFGFKEYSKINTDWKCFTLIPFPTMIWRV